MTRKKRNIVTTSSSRLGGCVTILRLFSYWRKPAFSLIVIIIFSLISVACSLLAPYLLGITIDQCINDVSTIGKTINFGQLGKMLLIFFLINLIGSFCIWVQEYLLKRSTMRIIKSLCEELIDKTLKLTIRCHNKQKRGKLMSYFTNDIELIKNALSNCLVQLITSILTLTGSLLIMLHENVTLTFVACVTIPMTIFLSRFIIRHTRAYFSQQQKALSSLNGMVEEYAVGIRTIKNFCQEEKRNAKFKQLDKYVYETGKKAQIYSGILMPLLRVLDNLSYLLVTVAGAFLAFRGHLSVGMIQTFLLYTKNFQRPINAIATQINAIQAAIAGAERIFAFLNEDEETGPTEACIRPRKNQFPARVDFNNVHFTYDGKTPAIDGVTFSIEPGETVAIVGTTGAGKTTLIHLLSKFYEIQEGSISINGINIQSISTKDLRSMLSIVFQEPFLFSETVRYNIGYSKESVNEQELQSAAEAANIDTFIMNLPQQYEHKFMKQGEGISYGQQQLLTISRAILADAPILILDEATSNIDTRTELLLQQAIRRLTYKKTCLIIAHRLSTIRNADKIVVLENGKVAEQGRHEDLLAKKGIYWEIFNTNRNE